MTTEILKFGKFKGQSFNETPKWYQNWLVKQPWFNKPSDTMPKINPTWNGYSKKGEAQEWAVFEWEKRQALKDDCRLGICTCCPDSKYYGI